MMNKAFLYIFILTIFGCSEGDIIENDLEDITSQLENCANLSDNSFVFFQVDNNKAISVGFTSNTFDITPEIDDISTEEPTIIALGSDGNQLNYREFAQPIVGSEYFCTSVPPSDIVITEELVSNSGNLVVSYEELPSDFSTQRIFRRNVNVFSVTLMGDEIEIRRELIAMGNDIVTASPSINFNGTAAFCPETTTNTFRLYKLNGDRNRILTIDFVSDAFEIEPDFETISADNTIQIEFSNASNTLAYRDLTAPIEEGEENIEASLCGSTFPSSTRVLNGKAEGMLEITYEELDNVNTRRRFRRTFTLKNITIVGDTDDPEITPEDFIIFTQDITEPESEPTP